MSIPQFWNFPQDSSDTKALVTSLEEMYQKVAEGINGEYRASFLNRENQFTPVVYDSGNTSTTFTYTHQSGWVYRQGLMTQVWLDVAWTAASASLTGDLYIGLPYVVGRAVENPFVGVCQPSGFAFTAGTGCVLQAIPSTYRLEVWNTGNGVTTNNQSAVTSGRVMGHIVYPGRSDE